MKQKLNNPSFCSDQLVAVNQLTRTTMRTTETLARATFPNTIARRLRTACATRLLPLLLLLSLPAVVQAQSYTDIYGIWTYTTTNGRITITQYHGTNAAVTIPNTIHGLPVTSIGVNAFINNCSNLASVTIGTNVTSIAGYALFTDYLSFTAIIVDALNSVYSSEDGVLFNKSQTTLIQCPQGKAGSYTIPNSVTNIGSAAFEDCLILTSVTIPNSVTSIGFGAFVSCWNLASVTIPNSVTSIGDDAFLDAGLTNVTIGSGVTSVGQLAFIYCTGLAAIYFQGNAPSFGAAAFEFDSNATVYYLPGTTGWDTFGDLPTALWFLPNPLILTVGPSFGVKTNQFGFIISWATNVPVVVEACTNLATASWTPLQACTLTDGWSYFSDPQWTNYPARLYRLRSP